MFKCYHSQERREIIILDTEWGEDGIRVLREKGREQVLLCSQCYQPVHVKAGEHKAWHFAHKDLGSCPLHSESPAILQARGLLYKWLCSKFANPESGRAEKASITVEKSLGEKFPKLVDCFLEFANGTKVAYWIFDRGMRDRRFLPFGYSGIVFRPVFVTSMLKMTEEHGRVVDLTPTERDFMAVPSDYDKMYQVGGGSLHYLDGSNATMITLRGVSLRHAPQRHVCSAVLTHGLMDILTNNQGEFIHPGEYERREAFLRIEKEQQAMIQRNKFSACPCVKESGNVENSLSHVSPGSVIPIQSQSNNDSLVIRRVQKKEPMLCEGCGIMTTNWTSCTPDNGLCLCRDCVNRQYGRT